ncbi:MAG: nucleotide exchange factor GrpE [Patescibacteria group bacterium]
MEDTEKDNKNNDESFDDVTFVESTEDGEELSGKDMTKKLREDLKTVRKEKEEYLTGWQRAKADYVNLQKEMTELRANSSLIAKEKMAKNFLPVLDSFDMAFANKDAWEKVDQNWRTGIEYIFQQFVTALTESGIEKIDQAHAPFDPNLHQSIDTVPTDDQSKDHTVERVLQAGYKIGERIVRPARVNIYEYKK